jgi:hypothetical protein
MRLSTSPNRLATEAARCLGLTKGIGRPDRCCRGFREKVSEKQPLKMAQ